MIAFAGEGLTDFKVIKNLLVGFFNDKNLFVTRLLPKETEPVGWGNLLNYITTLEFRNGVENVEFVIVQIDSGTCEEWGAGIKNLGDDSLRIEVFIQEIINFLIDKIGFEFYTANKDKIAFAISVHDIECWLLPFNSSTPAHYSKIVSCVKTLERIANQKGFSINKKNYQEGKHYEELSKEMKKHKILMEKHSLNPSLQIFIDKLKNRFKPDKPLNDQ